MNRNIFCCFQNISAFVISIAFITAMPVYSFAEEEGVFLDPQTGDYLVRFKSYTGLIEEGIFYPHTKIDPTVKSIPKLLDDESLVYHYKIKNSKANKQALGTVIIYVSNAHTTGQITPSGWDGSIVPNIGGSGYIVGWSFRTSKKSKGENETAVQGLSPGLGTAEFGFRSADLPGGYSAVAGQSFYYYAP